MRETRRVVQDFEPRAVDHGQERGRGEHVVVHHTGGRIRPAFGDPVRGAAVDVAVEVVQLDDLRHVRGIGLGRALLMVLDEVRKGGDRAPAIEGSAKVGGATISRCPPGRVIRVHVSNARRGLAMCSMTWEEITAS